MARKVLKTKQEIIMPVMKSGRGYKYGTSGKTYKGKGAKKKATKQGLAIQASKRRKRLKG